MGIYSDKKIALVGSGLIGSGWAIQFLYHGQKNICLYDTNPDALERAKERIEDGLQWLEKSGALSPEQHKEYTSYPTYTTNLKDAVQDAEFILENGPENLAIKQSILAGIEEYCQDEAIITSSTSAIMVREIAEKARRPQRVIGAHPYLPVYLLPLVEIVIDEKVEAKYLDKLIDFLQSVKKKPVVLKKDCPGYIGTRLMNAICREAVSMLYNGVCSVEDLDTAFTFGPGLRYGLMGPFMVYQLTGGDYGVRGLFGGRMNGKTDSAKSEPVGEKKKQVIETLCNWTSYPPEVGKFMVNDIPEQVDKIMESKNWTNADLAEFRDQGLLELLKYHDLL